MAAKRIGIFVIIIILESYKNVCIVSHCNAYKLLSGYGKFFKQDIDNC